MKYELYVWCRRDGLSRDAGLHATTESDSDQNAIDKLMEDGRWLLQFYDEVACSIVRADGDPLLPMDKRAIFRTILRRELFPEMDMNGMTFGKEGR